MDNFIKNLEIKNFKSIKHLTLDCKRVNVFIGKPNVGKSNILEALGLLGLKATSENDIFKSIRIGDLKYLFYESDTSTFIELSYNNWEMLFWKISNDYYRLVMGSPEIMRQASGDERIDDLSKIDIDILSKIDSKYGEFLKKGNLAIFEINKNLNLPIQKLYYDGYESLRSNQKKIKNYIFAESDENSTYWTLKGLPSLRSELAKIVEDYGLEFVLSVSDEQIRIQKRQDGFVTQYPYSSIADTFQRFIFYLAAIESNSNSVLVFEEPEVHSFPPYVKELAERMILKDDNQYFVSTHSPYLLQTFIDSLDDTQLNVYLTYYKDYQTHVKVLSSEELSDIQRFGYDVFFNLKKFIPND